MNRLSISKQTQILACLVEGNSIRATSRITGAAKGTILRLLCRTGSACSRYQDKVLRNLSCRRIQCDEIWAFCYAKDKNVPKDKRRWGYGDTWTWVAMCADTKLVPTWLVAPRNLTSAHTFMGDLASRLKHRVQLTTDGHKVYFWAVRGAFEDNVDFSMLVKIYGVENNPQAFMYGKDICTGIQKVKIQGNCDKNIISTSFVERNNLTMRMGMRRLTRLTNGFSKKVGNLIAAVSLHFMYYNFVRIHQSLGMTPAMAAKVVNRPFSLEDILKLNHYQS